MHYLLFYDVVEGYAERRIPFRAAHLEYAQAEKFNYIFFRYAGFLKILTAEAQRRRD